LSIECEGERGKVSAMPTYAYQCKECQKTFSVVQALSEHGKTAVKCANCSSGKVEQLFSAFFAMTESKA
jgi:putative FmdB family regulatory protein